MTEQTDLLRRSRLTLVLLASLFFAPFVGAWLIYNFFPEMRPTGTTNHGRLIAPALPVPALALADEEGKPLPDALRVKWTLVYLGSEQCDAACVERLVLVRQVRLALGQKLERVQRYYIAPDAAAQAAARETLSATHPGLRILADLGQPGARASDFFKPTQANAVYLVDPNGNWLMAYDEPSLDPADLLDDLKKLLRLSSIG